jgi:hypothetical protein
MVYLFFCPVIGSQVLLHGPCLESCDPLTLDCGGFQGLAASSTSKLLLSECQPFISVWCTKIYRNLFEWCTKKPGCPKHGQAGGSQAAAVTEISLQEKLMELAAFVPSFQKKTASINFRIQLWGKNTLQD